MFVEIVVMCGGISKCLDLVVRSLPSLNRHLSQMIQPKICQVPILPARYKKVSSWQRSIKKEQGTEKVVFLDFLIFLLFAGGRFRIWHKRHDSMERPCLMSAVQADSSGNVLLAHIMVPDTHLRTSEWYLNIFTKFIHSWQQFAHIKMDTSCMFKFFFFCI